MPIRKDLPSLADINSWPLGSAARFILSNTHTPREMLDKYKFGCGPRRVDQLEPGDVYFSAEDAPASFVVCAVETPSHYGEGFAGLHAFPLFTGGSPVARLVLESYRAGIPMPFIGTMSVLACGELFTREQDAEKDVPVWSSNRPYLSEFEFRRAKQLMTEVEKKHGLASA